MEVHPIATGLAAGCWMLDAPEPLIMQARWTHDGTDNAIYGLRRTMTRAASDPVPSADKHDQTAATPAL